MMSSLGARSFSRSSKIQGAVVASLEIPDGFPTIVGICTRGRGGIFGDGETFQILHIIKNLKPELQLVCSYVHTPLLCKRSAPTELLDEVARTVALCYASREHGEDPAESTDPNAPASLVKKMCELARFALGASDGGRRRTSARLREQALDCLRVTVEVASPRDQGAASSDVLDVTAVGARDDKWFVRAAAARVATEVTRHLDSRDALLRLSKSRHGFWLYALLIDDYPKVQESARTTFGIAGVSGTALNPRTPAVPGVSLSTAPQLESLPAQAWFVAAVSEAVHTAREVLLSSTPIPYDNEGVTGEREHAAEDLDSEESTRMALRSLRGISSMGSLLQSESVTSMTVESLQAVEAWLAVKLRRPPTTLPWEDGRSISQGDDSALGGNFVECRDTVRALASAVGMAREVRAAAIATLHQFRRTCRMLNGEGRRHGMMNVGLSDDAAADSPQDETEEETWRRLYCSFLVRLEVFAVVATSIEAPIPSPKASKQAKANSSAGHNGRGDDFLAEVDSWMDVVELLAQALEEVPCAYKAAALSFGDDEKMSASEQRARRLRVERIQQWITSCTQLLLRAGARLGNTRGSSSTGAVGAGDRHGALHLLVSTLPFEHPYAASDDPTDAWLSCVRPDPPSSSSGSLMSVAGRADGRGGTEESDLRLHHPGRGNVSQMSVAAASLVAEPIPWDECMCGRRRTQRQHMLPAPWASDSQTRTLATELIQTSWKRLFPDGGAGPAASRGTEGLIQTLRATARERGWREDTGVGVKHAVAGAIRRLLFPLITGDALGHALPLVLPLADDYDSAHQALGFSLVIHIIKQAMPTELAWHRGLLLEVLERGLRGGGRDASATALCLAAMVALLKRAPKSDDTNTASLTGRRGETAGRAGLRLAREALAQAGRTADGEFRVVVVAGAAALLELPATRSGYAPCEILRPALLSLLPVLQTSPSSDRVDARASTLRALHILTVSCWPRIHAHTAKLLCALLWTCGDISRRSPGGKDPTGGHVTPTDEIVSLHATRLGALVLTLSGESGKSTLQEICSALSALRPAASAMQTLAEEAALGSRGAGFSRD